MKQSNLPYDFAPIATPYVPELQVDKARLTYTILNSVTSLPFSRLAYSNLAQQSKLMNLSMSV
jgi:hypothetical protein